jgi:hypothetical protein
VGEVREEEAHESGERERVGDDVTTTRREPPKRARGGRRSRGGVRGGARVAPCESVSTLDDIALGDERPASLARVAMCRAAASERPSSEAVLFGLLGKHRAQHPGLTTHTRVF